jgi:hypothetical protein
MFDEQGSLRPIHLTWLYPIMFASWIANTIGAAKVADAGYWFFAIPAMFGFWPISVWGYFL